MKNNFLNYLKSNDPEKVVSKSGVRIRKFIFPALRLILKIANPYKLIIVRKAAMPENTPIIYASTHGFKDDILNAVLLANKPLYILLGALGHFFNSVEGVIAWLVGVILVDMDNKNSRRAALLKMKKAVELEADVLIYPEGAWNLTDSLLVMKLYSGVHRLAKSTGALVSPIATHIEGKNCYAILDEAFDIAIYEQEEGNQILRDKMATLKFELMEKYSRFTRAELEAGGKSLSATWEKMKENLLKQEKNYPPLNHEHLQYKDRNITEYEEAFAHLQDIEITRDNAFLLRKWG